MQKPDRREDHKAQTPSREAPTQQGAAGTRTPSWTRPDFTEASACAEICAYVFVA
jgi:hypothetical protein